jgi:oligo-1,6-glucosidase
MQNKTWWKEAVVYQIYPRSFMDSNGDGIGDLAGIASRLDYLKWLGVDILWLSPVYKSPNDDMGYDISDYQDIMDEFGTMADFDNLLEQAHKRGIRIILDLVVNHTSDEHAWFIESRSSKDSSKRDWYIWLPPKGGKEPNNWKSVFGGPAWQFDKRSGEYYLHNFSKKQPDLNWRNAEVKKAVFDMMRWWCEKGIDGFRMDVINFLLKEPGFPDVPGDSAQGPFAQLKGGYIMNRPGMHELLAEMNREVLSKYDIMSVGECHCIDAHSGLAYVAYHRKELDMTFQFDIMSAGRDLALLKKRVKEWYDTFKGKAWNTITLANHDTCRLVSSFGNDTTWRKESARLLATFLLTAPATPYFLQGDEIGMTDVRFDSIDDYRDIQTLNRYNERIARGEAPAQALEKEARKSRDNSRTPMQWDDSTNAGFTSGHPWLNINPNYKKINVAESQSDPNSIANYYRNCMAFRKKHPALIYGDYIPLDNEHPQVYAYRRSDDKEDYLIIMNWSDSECRYPLCSVYDAKKLKTLLCSYENYVDDFAEKEMNLRAWEARLCARA